MFKGNADCGSLGDENTYPPLAGLRSCVGANLCVRPWEIDNMPEDSFEEALKKLEEVVKTLEEGDLPLEESLSLFEEGIRLSRLCAQKLDEVEKKIEILVRDNKGNKKVEPFSRGEGE